MQEYTSYSFDLQMHPHSFSFASYFQITMLSFDFEEAEEDEDDEDEDDSSKKKKTGGSSDEAGSSKEDVDNVSYALEAKEMKKRKRLGDYETSYHFGEAGLYRCFI